MQEFNETILLKFLNRAVRIQTGTGVPSEDNAFVKKIEQTFYEGLHVSASYGKGRAASIPWIAFLGKSQTVPNGIYPVFLYHKKHDILFLAYGISAYSVPELSWNVKGIETIGEYCERNALEQSKIEEKYNSSFVKAVYQLVLDANGDIDTGKLDFNRVMDDLESMVEPYKKLLGKDSEKQEMISVQEIEQIEGTVTQTSWVLPSNLKQYDVHGAFHKNGVVDWHWLSPNAKVGDTVYIYISGDVKRIVFKTRISVLNIQPKDFIDDSEFVLVPDSFDDEKPHTRLELLKEDKTEDLTFENLKAHGLNGNIQGPMKLQGTLLEYVERVFENEISTVENPVIEQELFSIKEMISLINETGLLYSDALIKRFAFSLMSKQFVILSGLAGSGKTQLALAFASTLVEDEEKQMRVVSVGADWTNREPLLGFPNALQEDKYVRPESGVLDLLIEANKEENRKKPYFLILDEMNMSYVERYFADFLSAMESYAPIQLWKGTDAAQTPQSILLPANLFVIGTINVDETTYMFSPKVLDRANVIEFKISEREMEDFLSDIKPVDRNKINGKAAGMGCDFVELAGDKELAGSDEIKKTLNSFFSELKKVNAEFGYRSATEIFRFICQAEKNDDTDEKFTLEQILDAAIVQKLLPKLHGSRKKLEPVLQQLWKLCLNDADKDTTPITRDYVGKAKFKDSADKIRRMYESAQANGFTSFAEA